MTLHAEDLKVIHGKKKQQTKAPLMLTSDPESHVLTTAMEQSLGQADEIANVCKHMSVVMLHELCIGEG